IAFLLTISRETSTLPTFVLITWEFVFLAISSIPDVELIVVISFDLGFLSRMNLERRRADLSPVKIFPLLSQKILLSPSPSNAIPRSALVLTTLFDRSCKFSGVGSEPLPGNDPLISSLIVITSHPSSRHILGAVVA